MPASSGHMYEDVDMITNRRYLSNKLETKDHTLSHEISLSVHSPLPDSGGGGAAVYSYTTCSEASKASANAAEVYEVMKPSGSVKTTAMTDNVCYSLEK